MKKVLLASLALILLVSFTGEQPQARPHKNSPSPGVSWWIDRESTDYNVVLENCRSGLEIFVPEITTHLDLHGVENKNVSLTQGYTTISGTGINLATGEEFTIYERGKINANFPVVNGTIVVTLKVSGALTGNQGTVEDLFYRSHIVINANGETVVDRRSFTCPEK